MKNLLGKKLNKKGFTLAELLIVVAIIAILVAIALPLFFGALDNAREQRDAANKRSAKSMAVNMILRDPDKYAYTEAPEGVRVKADSWHVTAYISDDGTIDIDADSVYPQFDMAEAGKESYLALLKSETFERVDGGDHDGWHRYMFYLYDEDLNIGA